MWPTKPINRRTNGIAAGTQCSHTKPDIDWGRGVAARACGTDCVAHLSPTEEIQIRGARRATNLSTANAVREDGAFCPRPGGRTGRGVRQSTAEVWNSDGHNCG